VSRAMRRCSPVSFTKVAVACLEIFTSGSASQPLDDAHNLPEIPSPTPAVRTERALRSAPVVLVRGVRMPAYAEAGTSIVMKHSLNFPFNLGRPESVDCRSCPACRRDVIRPPRDQLRVPSTGT
jgi:hypothetical protein